MPRLTFITVTGLAALGAITSTRADLNTLGIFNGNVGLSVDAIGSAEDPVGKIRAEIPDGATVLAAYLYSAGTPYPWYPNGGGAPSPQTLGEYNTAGITLGGQAVNFTGIVGATSDRADVGQWYTGKADVTSQVQSLLQPGKSSYLWDVSEGTLNDRIDGELLAVVYSDPSLPKGSVVLLDGGQRTGGELKNVGFSAPLGDATAPGFKADMSLGISFSLGDSQNNIIDVNGTRLTSSAGGYDDGVNLDGGLITAGGIGDSNANPVSPFSTDSSQDDELYSLKSLLHTGDTGLTIFTQNPSNDDNIFFAALNIQVDVGGVVDVPLPDSGSTLPLLAFGAASLPLLARKKTR